MGEIAWSSLGLTFAATAVAVVALMALVLVNVARTGTVTIIDTVWGLGFAVAALAGLAASWGEDANTLRLLVTALTVVWGARLAAHLYVRNRGRGEDHRYDDLFARHAGSRVRVAAIWVCLPQAAILWFVSLPVQFAQNATGVSAWWWPAVGAAVWGVGFAFETIGDAQLKRFRADPANHGKVLDTGLWRYTRHPNYFGDACVWWGLYLCACVTWPGALTFLAPAVMTFVLARGTGKPLMERYMSQRDGYAQYVERTSGFLPLPPKKG